VIVLRLDIVTENVAAGLIQVCEQFLETTAERVEEPRLVVVGSYVMAVFDESALDQLVTIPRRDWKHPVPAAEEVPGEPA